MSIKRLVAVLALVGAGFAAGVFFAPQFGKSDPAQARHMTQAESDHAGHTMQDDSDHAGHAMRDGSDHSGHIMQDESDHAGHTMQDGSDHAGHNMQHEPDHAGHTMQDEPDHSGHMMQDHSDHAGHMAQDQPDHSNHAANDEPAEREVLYWVAPMDPNFRRDKPGKSPMGMDLVPVYADQNKDRDGAVTISPSVENNLGVRTETAKVRPLWRRVEATGYVGFDETRITDINTRVEGWIVRLNADAEGERVNKGDLLFELYSPELVNAQKEYLQALRRGADSLRAGAEEKLRALGMIAPEITALRERGTASESIRIVAPQDGIIASLSVREGMFIQPNTTIMSLADLSSVWLQAEIFESQSDWVSAGQAAEARFDYLPGTKFTGQVDYVYPVLDPQTRTLRARLRFDNPDERLKPNMYARVSIFGRLRPNALTIPREALIPGSQKDRVVIALGDGKFRVHEVLTGLESGEYVEILAGLSEGDEVVTSAQFLIDSESSISGSIKRLDPMAELPEQRELGQVYASGRVDEIDLEHRRLRISHGPIDALGWPSMTMVFDTRPEVDLSSIDVGQDVSFVLVQEHAGEYVLERIISGQNDD